MKQTILPHSCLLQAVCLVFVRSSGDEPVSDSQARTNAPSHYFIFRACLLAVREMEPMRAAQSITTRPSPQYPKNTRASPRINSIVSRKVFNNCMAVISTSINTLLCHPSMAYIVSQRLMLFSSF